MPCAWPPTPRSQPMTRSARQLSYLPAGRWLAFRAEEEFPADTTVTVNVGPGTPSAEGPLVSKEAQTFSFQTYAPLRVVESYCGWQGGPCQPGTPFTIRFNNPLDTKSVSQESVTVEPAIPGMVVSASYDTLQICRGYRRAHDLSGQAQGRCPGHLRPDSGRRPGFHLQDRQRRQLSHRPQPGAHHAGPDGSHARLYGLQHQLQCAACARLCRHAGGLASLSRLSAESISGAESDTARRKKC